MECGSDYSETRTAAKNCPCGIQSITMGLSEKPSAGMLFSGVIGVVAATGT